MSRHVNPGKATSPYVQAIHFTPPEVAFCDSAIPGLSTYPQPGHLEQWQAEREKHGNPPWASCEGTAIDPGEAERSGHGMNMESYLGNLFNHGAVLVNIFGWGVGDRGNPFRKIAEGEAHSLPTENTCGGKAERSPDPHSRSAARGIEGENPEGAGEAPRLDRQEWSCASQRPCREARQVFEGKAVR